MRLYVARRAPRKGMFIRTKGSRNQPNLMFLLDDKTDRGHLDELIRAQLEKQGVSGESAIQSLVDSAEAEYERKRKIEDVQRELRRLMDLKLQGYKLGSVGFRKWQPIFYTAHQKAK